jgi:hypothetical protein
MTSSTHRDKDAALDWESAGLQLIDATLYASLRAFRNYNTFSVDELLQSKASKVEPR